jgi:hypothetical protein
VNNLVGSPQLIIQTPGDVQHINLLARQEWTIGRDRANLIRIPDRYASRFHAVLGIYKDRHCYFWDLSSRNGSVLNGEPIVGAVLLKHGDRITIGNTLLLLRHNFVTTPQIPTPQPQQQVLMIQTSAIQGKIWQELLLSQKIGVRWEIPGINIKEMMSLQSAANVLPPLIILDTQAFHQDELYGLCHWCRQQQLDVHLVLIDSKRYDIPEAEQAYSLQQGFLNFFPAFHPTQLLTHTPQIRQRLQSMLQVFDQKPLKHAAMLSALKNLKQVLHKSSAAAAQRHQSAPILQNAWHLEDMTSLKVDPRKLKQAKKE